MDGIGEENKKFKMKRSTFWKLCTLGLGVLLIVSIFTGGFRFASITGKTTIETLPKEGELPVILLNDKRCGQDCDATMLVAQLKATFSNIKISELDYSSKDGKKLYEETGVKFLPAVLFSDAIKQEKTYNDISNYLEQKGKYLSLKIGATFDPNAEICDNKIDDDKNGKVDCSDEYCKSEWKCMEKRDKVDVELFVMSHCPYGTQVEKGILPVVEALGSKVNFNVKFCDYAMHGEKEIKEEVNQYCIQKEQNNKFLSYLKCFLEAGDSEGCLKKVGIDIVMLSKCADATDKEFSVMKLFNDQSTWLNGRYSLFNVHKADVDKYSVAGSPTLVINGVVAETGRDPNSLLNAVCTGYKEKPSECSKSLSSTAPSAGFGFTASSTDGSTTGAECGV